MSVALPDPLVVVANPDGTETLSPWGVQRDLDALGQRFPLKAADIASGGVIYDTYANRPTASAALEGVHFTASDKLMQWRSVSSAWVLVSVFAPEVSSLPTSPVDQQECIYVADTTNGVKFHFRYRSASASAYKWETIGGADLHSPDVTTRTGTSGAIGTWQAINSGNAITLPLAGDWDFTMIGSLLISSATAATMGAGIATTAAPGTLLAGGFQQVTIPGSGAAFWPLNGLNRVTGLSAVAVTTVIDFSVATVSWSVPSLLMRARPVRVG